MGVSGTGRWPAVVVFMWQRVSGRQQLHLVGALGRG